MEYRYMRVYVPKHLYPPAFARRLRDLAAELGYTTSHTRRPDDRGHLFGFLAAIVGGEVVVWPADPGDQWRVREYLMAVLPEVERQDPLLADALRGLVEAIDDAMRRKAQADMDEVPEAVG